MHCFAFASREEAVPLGTLCRTSRVLYFNPTSLYISLECLIFALLEISIHSLFPIIIKNLHWDSREGWLLGITIGFTCLPPARCELICPPLSLWQEPQESPGLVLRNSCCVWGLFWRSCGVPRLKTTHQSDNFQKEKGNFLLWKRNPLFQPVWGSFKAPERDSLMKCHQCGLK